MKKYLTLFATGALAFSLVACDGEDTAGTDTPTVEETTATVEETTATTAKAAVQPAPTVIPLPITFAEDQNDIRLDETDIGQHIVDGVDNERGVFDRGAWRVVAQCDDVVDGRLKVGVIKEEEFTVISQAGQGRSISENFFKFVLECPEG